MKNARSARWVLVALAVCAFAAGGCQNARQKLEQGNVFLTESQKDTSLEGALQKIEKAQELFKSAAADTFSLPYSFRASRRLKVADEAAASLESARASRVSILELARLRKYEDAIAAADELPARGAEAFDGVLNAEVENLKKAVETRRREYADWQQAAVKTEAMFRDQTDYDYWRRPGEVVPDGRDGLVLTGYRMGYDSPDGSVSHFKVGWLLGAMKRSTREAIAELEQAEAAGLSKAAFYRGILLEADNRPGEAGATFKRLRDRKLPEPLGAIAKRRAVLYASLAGAESAQRLEKRFEAILKARLASPIANPGDAACFPLAATAASKNVWDEMKGLFVADWARDYPFAAVVYRRAGNLNTYPANSGTLRDRRSLEPVLKYTYFMLFINGKKGIDLDDAAVQEKFQWFEKFLDSVGKGLAPERQADEFRSRVGDEWGREVPYFGLAGNRRWAEASASLRDFVEAHGKQK